MDFKLRITNVAKLPSAGIEVLQGDLLAGAVTTGQQVTLVHGDQRATLRVAGVSIGAGRPAGRPKSLSLSFKRQPGLELAAEGDELIA